MGGGFEPVVILADGEKVWISRTGRLYGEPAEVRLQNVGGELEVLTRAQVMERIAQNAPIDEVLE